MSFDFDKIDSKHDENWWSSYADLFSMISVIFLMMYVVSSMRSGIGGVQTQMQFQQISKENQDLKQQLEVYNTLKEDQLKDSSDQEQEVYQGLMKRLTLLQDEARDEKDNLRKQAKENEEKEFALNQYQQIVRNIINTNVLAKTQIKRKDTLISTKNVDLKEKQQIIEEQENDLQQSAQEISQLESSVDQKEQTIAENQQKIDQVNQALENKISQLRQQQEAAQITKAQLNSEINKLTDESQQTIAQLEARKRQTQLALEQTKNNLDKVQEEMVEQQKQNATERERLVGEMQDVKGQYQGQIAALHAEHQEQIAEERAARERLKKMGAKQRAAQEAKLRAEAAARESEFKNAIGDLNGKIADSERDLADNLAQVENLRGQVQAASGRLAASEREKGRLAAEKARLAGSLEATEAEKGRLSAEKNRLAGNLAAAEGEKGRLAADRNRALASVSNLEKERENLSGELKRAQEVANAKKKLIGQIKQNLKTAGLEAEVDAKSGDVVLSFGEEYFDTGSAILKPSMTGILKRFMPSYSDSLFNDPNIADKITNVEIVGYASPTFNGKYVNPESLNPKDQEAIRYNLKLSSSRAQAIFNFIFDTKKLKYQKQRDLLPKVKVVGRGYLPNGKKWDDIPKDMSEKEFCKRFNCQKAQRVVIRFNME